jgi:hypothetical protein
LGGRDIGASGIRERHWGGRLLKYTSRQLTKINSELLFVLDTSSRKEVNRTVFFEFHEGVLSRLWVEETEST